MYGFSFLAFVSFALASPIRSGLHPRDTGPASPISVASANYLCDINSTNVNVVHDLGYVGKIGDNVVYTWGDTLAGPGASFWMTSDSSSVGTSDPCSVLVTALVDDSHPAELVPIEANWGETNTADAMGGTNIVATEAANTGMMFYLANHRPIGGDDYIVGAGVATVTMSGNVPTASRLAKNWWDAQAGEPNYGDITAYAENFIWGLGHGSSDGAYSYLTRAPMLSYQDFNSWEYFDGETQTWSNNRLFNPTPEQALQWNEEEGPVWMVDQGQMIWSSYYNKIMFVYGMNFGNADGTYSVLARTADRPRGPWSSAVELYTVTPLQEKGMVYAMIPNPYFDETGKTLIVTVTNTPNTNQATKVTFA